MSEGMLSAADIAAVNRANNVGYGYNDGFGMGGCWFWIVLLLFFGRGNWGNYDNFQTDVDTRFLERDIFNTNQNVSNTACQTQRDVLSSSCQTQRDVLENRYTTQLGLTNLGAEMQECCCNTQKEILQNRYDNALQAQTLSSKLDACCCDLRTAIHAEGEETRALIQANTIQDLRDRINERDRELQSAQFQISQVSQTSNIVNTLRPFPQPAYITCSPYQSYGIYGGYGCGCNNGCCNY